MQRIERARLNKANSKELTGNISNLNTEETDEGQGFFFSPTRIINPWDMGRNLTPKPPSHTYWLSWPHRNRWMEPRPGSDQASYAHTWLGRSFHFPVHIKSIKHWSLPMRKHLNPSQCPLLGLRSCSHPCFQRQCKQNIPRLLVTSWSALWALTGKVLSSTVAQPDKGE